MCSSQRERAMQDRLADRHQQMIAKICNAAPNKNMAWIKEINQRCHHIPDCLPAVANDIEGGLISLPTRRVDIFRTDEASIRLSHLTQDGADPIDSGLHRLCSNRRAGGHCFQAANISAGTQRTIFIHADVADITSGTVTAAMDLSVRDNARSNSGPYFDKYKVVNVYAISRATLTQCHDIHIVINCYKGR